MCLYCFASLQNSVHTRLMHPCIACPSRCPDYLHLHKHRQPRTIPRQAPHLAYERSVGFASIAIVVVCGRCVLHRLGSTTYKHPCLNSGRSISGILARPLPKVSFCCLSLAQPTIEGSPPRLSPLPQTPPTPHYPSPRTTQNPNLPPAAVTTIIHHSLFIIH